MKLFLSLLLVVGAGAQTVSLGGPLIVGTTTININVKGFTGKNIAAFQFSATVPSGTTIAPVVVSPPPNKIASCAINTTTNTLVCVISGNDATPIVDGIVAIISLSATTAAAALTPTALLGATGLGDAFTILTGSPCDVNGDGKTDLNDVQNVIDQIRGIIIPATTDLNGDGKTTVIDLQRVVNAVAGGTCRAGA